VLSTPTGAKILIDGADSGAVTPATDGNHISLSPGKHKVTLVTPTLSNTYTVVITSGASTILKKELK
jgi:hypothetical protein